MKRLMLLGGGHAHVHVLAEMAREPFPGVQAVLVTPYARQIYSGMVPGLVAGHYEIDECAIALEPLAYAAGVELAIAHAASVDAATRTVTLADGRAAQYDILSLDVGSTMDRDQIPGARQHALFVRPMEHFVRLLDGMFDFASRRALDVVVVGGGAAGFELAMALQHRLSRTGVDAAGRVCVVAGNDGLLPNYTPAVRQRGLAALKRARIAVFNDRCVEITAGHVVLERGPRLACDAPVMALSGSAPPWLAGSGLALDEAGYVLTGPSLQSVSHAEVFAAGDVSVRQAEPHPRSGVYAVRAGPPLAFNLRRALAGGELRAWQPQGRSLNLLSCGERRVIASWGTLSLEGRWLWGLKDRIDRGFVDRYERPAVPGGASAPRRPPYTMQSTMPQTAPVPERDPPPGS